MTAQPIGEQLLLSPSDVPPLRDDWQVISVFNPGVASDGERGYLLARVAERPAEKRAGKTALPRWQEGQLAVDWTDDADLLRLDSRVVMVRESGRVRLTFTSHLRRFLLEAGLPRPGDPGQPVLLPEGETETFGVEDPRIVQIDQRYWISYVAVSSHGPATALASTEDFVTFQRHGVVFCPENKDVLLFPERVGGRFVALHRPVLGTPFCKPEMWLARSDDLLHWGDHRPLYGGTASWESGRVGGGAPPVKTERGWLLLYHGNQAPQQTGEVGAYYAAALLLDHDDPARIVARCSQPLRVPTAPFEREGFVPNVVFPTAAVIRDDRLLIYYGAADTHTALLTYRLSDVLDRMA